MLAQILAGIVLIVYKNKPSFAIFDGTIQNELRQAMGMYCEYLPVPIPQLPSEAEELFIGEYYTAVSTFTKPVQDVVGEECRIPPPRTSQEECLTNYQYPCQEAIVLWLNSQLFWVGVALLGLMGLELLIFAIGVYYVVKVSNQKKASAEECAKIIHAKEKEQSKKAIAKQQTKSKMNPKTGRNSDEIQPKSCQIKQQKPVKIEMQNLREPPVYQGTPCVSPGNTPSAPPPPPAPTATNQAFMTSTV